ncbi:MAG TPA: hypothetical protein VE988_18200 [Gemmataceae bacterium]|nr:hypothetical protein [Gemmataceae bacterium]
MITKQLPGRLLELQDAIYRVALSLDAFLVNGIQYGLLQPIGTSHFLQKAASSLLRDLASLEEQASQAVDDNKMTETLAALRTKCQQVVDLVVGLDSFRTLPLQQLRATVNQIPVIRGECAQLIQELEAAFQTPKPFYQPRPMHSAAGVSDFLADLEQAFVKACNGSNEQNEHG